MLTKQDFLLRDDITFLNHGSFGACPRVMLDEQRRWIELLEEQPVLYFRELMVYMRHAREALATYVGARPENLVFVQNSTFGVNVVAHAIGQLLQPEDEILANDHEYGACDRAWNIHAVSRGAVYVQAHVPVPTPSPEEVADCIWSRVTDRTKVLFISHITSPTAVRLPIEDLCARARSRGIITIVDGSHAPGHVPLDLSSLGADIYTANCHKWMCTPKGSAFLWASDEWKERLGPLVVSWGSINPTIGDGPFIDDHEFLGTRDHSPFLCLPFALQWMSNSDWSSVQEKARTLSMWGVDALCAIPGIRPLLQQRHDPLLQMGAVLLPPSTDVLHMKAWLYDERSIEVVVHKWQDTPILRFSVHAHTTQADLERLVVAVQEYLEKPLS